MRPAVTVAEVTVVAQRAMARTGVRGVICPTAKPLASRSSTARTPRGPTRIACTRPVTATSVVGAATPRTLRQAVTVAKAAA